VDEELGGGGASELDSETIAELDSGATAELDNSLELLSFASDDESGFAKDCAGNCGFESEQLAQKNDATVKLNRRKNLWIVIANSSLNPRKINDDRFGRLQREHLLP
jgi:hypothetical protein